MQHWTKIPGLSQEDMETFFQNALLVLSVSIIYMYYLYVLSVNITCEQLPYNQPERSAYVPYFYRRR